MNKYFWREKNADVFKEKNEVYIPTLDELVDELINKFYEKLGMIDVIFVKQERDKYLAKKNKLISENMPELVIRQKIGTRVIVDFLQLIKDFCDLKNLNINFEFEVCNKDKENICKSLKYAINNLKVEPQTSVQIIFENVFSLMDLLQLNYEDMEKVGDWLYKDATIYLVRKNNIYNLFKEHYNQIKNKEIPS